jgi:hypothetical protein
MLWNRVSQTLNPKPSQVDFDVEMLWNRVSQTLNPKPSQVDFDVEMFWNRVDGKRVIQAHAPPQPPALTHPDTGLPTWFCNVHSHSLVLRDERDGVLPETTGASRLNKSDCLFGDGTPIPVEDLRAIDKTTRDNIVPVLMEKGDVCLVDNYRLGFRCIPPTLAHTNALSR